MPRKCVGLVYFNISYQVLILFFGRPTPHTGKSWPAQRPGRQQRPQGAIALEVSTFQEVLPALVFYAVPRSHIVL